MSLLVFAQWLEQSALSTAFRESTWAYPLVEATHVLALVPFFGLTLVLDGRLLGAVLADTPVSVVMRRLLPWIRWSFAVMAVTGAVLFAGTPVQFLDNVFFQAKFLLLALAGINVWVFHHRLYPTVREWDERPRSARRAACRRRVPDSVVGRRRPGTIDCLQLVPVSRSMSLLPIFTWCNDTAIGAAVRGSVWLFPVIEVVHLVALAMLGGAVLLVDLRLLGLGLREVPVNRLAAAVRPWWWAGLAAISVSGVLLFLSEALKCYENPAFWAKVTALTAALLFTGLVRSRWTGVHETSGPMPGARLVAVMSLALWTTVAAAGRGIGYW